MLLVASLQPRRVRERDADCFVAANDAVVGGLLALGSADSAWRRLLLHCGGDPELAIRESEQALNRRSES